MLVLSNTAHVLGDVFAARGRYGRWDFVHAMACRERSKMTREETLFTLRDLHIHATAYGLSHRQTEALTIAIEALSSGNMTAPGLSHPTRQDDSESSRERSPDASNDSIQVAGNQESRQNNLIPKFPLQLKHRHKRQICDHAV